MTRAELYAKYPVILAQVTTDIEVGNGWLPLIDKLCQLIFDTCMRETLRVPVATQIKEKFGSLRFYVDQADDMIYQIIDRAEDLSSYICETCGAPGKISGKRWLKCTCPEHNEK